MQIAENAFGGNLRTITAPNGSYGLYWASEHGVSFNTGKDYDLVPGVIDFTGCGNHVQKRGNDYVAFSVPEGLQLVVGSIIFVRDSRNQDFFYRVTELTEANDRLIATVEIPDVKDAIINLETTVEIHATDADFIPADGVVCQDDGFTSRTISTV